MKTTGGNNLFGRYTENTNGKDIVGNCLVNIIKKAEYKSCLDIGAGRGEIATVLAPALERIVMVEPCNRYIQEMKNGKHENIEIAEKRIEDYHTREQYDLILMSYFLDSFDEQRIRYYLELAWPMLEENGKLVGVTYLDGCDWDAFIHHIAQRLTIDRTGGFSRLLERLRKRGWNMLILEIVDTEIRGDNLGGLYENLAFFAKDDLDGYRRFHDEYMEDLAKYISVSHGSVVISLKEVIYQIIRG